ncbi:MAG TPA: trehalose-phosphatase [Acidimicrobiia bacterium]|nr:trehalose-phosphatase [Acidimicrobiia bacterium]
MTSTDLEAALARVATAEVLLVASDYDGVLSPIVPEPEDAVPHRGALDAFLAVSRHPSVRPVIISGRSEPTLESFVGTPIGVRLIGNHGALLGGAPTNEERATVASITEALTAVAARHPGAAVEPKRLGAAFHYRHAGDRSGALNDARDAVAAFDARIIEGKEVLEVVIGHGTKGTAIEAVRAQTDAEFVVYVGDDVTDEDVFVSLGTDDIGIKVGDGPTAARFRIGGPDDVATTFATLEGFLSARR